MLTLAVEKTQGLFMFLKQSGTLYSTMFCNNFRERATMQSNQHFSSSAMVVSKQWKCSGTYKNFLLPRESAKCCKQKIACFAMW